MVSEMVVVGAGSVSFLNLLSAEHVGAGDETGELFAIPGVSDSCFNFSKMHVMGYLSFPGLPSHGHWQRS